ncbi:MAG: carboxypeptidase-like regulatory domain-containing protein, partial [Candidatus Hydrogenedentota bacterium]
RDQDAQQYGTTVKLKAGETRELDLTIPDTFTMSIQVYEIGGYPVENARVVILQGGGGDSNQHTRTDAEGRFSWSGFSPGMACGFSLSSGSSGLALSKIVVGEPGEVVPEEILVLEQFGGIEGVAITEDGKVIQNADIAVNISYGEDKNSLFILKINEFGEFVTLDDIPAATVTLSMFIDNQTLGWGWDSQAFVVPAENVVNQGNITFKQEK